MPNSSSPDRLTGNGGFTLWEMLIVVAIVTITVTMMQLAPSLNRETRELERLGSDLGRLFRLLNQEAVFESRNYAISVQADRFVVLEYLDQDWAVAEDRFFEGRRQSATQRSLLIIEDEEIDLAPTDPLQPHILILASGEMTPFEWRISDRQTESVIVLQGNLLGRVMMTGPEPLES